MAAGITRRRALKLLLAAAALPALAACSAPWETPTPTASAPLPRPGTPIPIPGREDKVDGYLAVAPKVLRSGQSERVSFSLFSGQTAAGATVEALLLQSDKQVAKVSGYVAGRGDLQLNLPALAEGDYQLRVQGRDFQAQSPVRVEDGTLVFVETDKPIYKPGQTIHIRTLTLDPELKPAGGTVSVEALDAKGLKVFKKDVPSDEYGMGALDLPLSPEPNLGTWKLTALLGKRTAQIDVRVERYVLPKYEVTVDLPKDWVLASDRIKGTVGAEYSYGKPVKGELVIKASRYVGTWQEFANATKTIDGKVDFDLPPVRYVAGAPGAKGLGNVQLDVTVRETGTGYEEKTSRLIAIAQSPVTLSLIPDSVSFKPGLPLGLLVVAETPDRKPVDADVQLVLSYTSKEFKNQQQTQKVRARGGKALVSVTPPADAIALTANANANNAYAAITMNAGHSPSGTFIHLEQTSQGALKVGDTAQFHVSATKEAVNFYYEVVSRGKVVFSDFTPSADIQFTLTPLMAPTARLLVYQVLQTSEVAADYLPFAISGTYPQQLAVAFAKEEVKPGEEVDLTVQAQGQAKVGLAAVDRSVFILAENRLNLRQVFDELEKLYQKPQAELHEARPLASLTAPGAAEVFQDAGVVVISNKNVPAGKQYENPMNKGFPGGLGAAREAMPLAVPAAAPAPMAQDAAKASAGAIAQSTEAGGLAEVQRVRQFFPETWIWDNLTTDASGKASKKFAAPDSITTWMLRAVALSKSAGLGIAEAQLKVMQPFFAQIDLTYSAIRGEQFPVKVALYNYTNKSDQYTVEIEKGDWFDLNGPSSQQVTVGPNDVGGASFTIRPTKLGNKQVKITARSREQADALIKDLLIEAEGVAREEVENVVLAAGSSKELAMGLPDLIVEGSARGFVAVTGSFLTQSIQGLEKLIQMPFGCGEQNMILFAPNVFVAKYLRETGQMKPEIMAKAETMMVTGYQRELTYRRSDGSFSAFGNQDKDGSLWLTAFVMKTFAQAKGLVFIDDQVQGGSRAWVTKQQKADGSFQPVGFLHHQDMLGGLKGNTALTAFVAIALKETGDDAAAAKAVRFLEGALGGTDDPYAVAITTYALALAKSGKTAAAKDKLIKLAKQSDEGLYWGGNEVQPLPAQQAKPGIAPGAPGILPVPRPNQSAAIETTGYAILALLEANDPATASRATRWLVSQRNSFGGFGSTQDTVVGLQALTRFASNSRTDVDATVVLRAGNWQKELPVNPGNADVLQLVDVPLGSPLTAEARGKGQVVLQGVRRYNVPEAGEGRMPIFQLDVQYSAAEIEVNDLITITARITFNPPEPMEAGMTVLDVAVPTGFAPETPSIDNLVQQQGGKIKRYDVAGRKVIFYIENMQPGDRLQFAFQARALFPVKAQAVTSQAYSYYKPEWKGEVLAGAMVVR